MKRLKDRRNRVLSVSKPNSTNQHSAENMLSTKILVPFPKEQKFSKPKLAANTFRFTLVPYVKAGDLSLQSLWAPV